ncbi:hypothetical protein QTP88_010787 [Uroleucon formosanum]
MFFHKVSKALEFVDCIETMLDYFRIKVNYIISMTPTLTMNFNQIDGSREHSRWADPRIKFWADDVLGSWITNYLLIISCVSTAYVVCYRIMNLAVISAALSTYCLNAAYFQNVGPCVVSI